MAEGVQVLVEDHRHVLPRVWSPTAINDFLRCPLAYWWKHAQGWRPRPSAVTATGTLVHDVLEALLRLPAQERTTERARELFRSVGSQRSQAGEYEGFGAEVWERGAAAMRAYLDLEDPAAVEPIHDGLEIAVAGVLAGVEVAGRADRVEYGTGGARIVDYKTGGAHPRHAVDAWRQQLVCAGLLTDAGITVTEVELLHLGDPSRRLRRPVPAAALERVMADVAVCAAGRDEATGSGRWLARPQPLCASCAFRWACPAKVAGMVPAPGSPDSDVLLGRNRALVRRVAVVDEVDRVGNPEELA